MNEIGWDTLGLRLKARVLGDACNPTIIMLHGFLDTGAAFVRVAQTLLSDWQVVIPDQRGHGQSDRIGAGGYYHFPDYILDLDGLYRALEIDQAVIVGHSMGASVACYFAGAFPERVSALALLDGIGPPREAGADKAPLRMRRWVDDVRRREAHVPKGYDNLESVARSIGRLSKNAPIDRLKELAKEAVEVLDDGRFAWKFDPMHRTQAPMQFDVERFYAFLERVQCPVLALWAEESPMHSDDEAQRLKALGQVTSVTVPNTAHNLHHERPEEVGQHLQAFLTNA
jgi:pimeloyl-ACP methyl ester carboxylesterase